MEVVEMAVLGLVVLLLILFIMGTVSVKMNNKDLRKEAAATISNVTQNALDAIPQNITVTVAK